MYMCPQNGFLTTRCTFTKKREKKYVLLCKCNHIHAVSVKYGRLNLFMLLFASVIILPLNSASIIRLNCVYFFKLNKIYIMTTVTKKAGMYCLNEH